MKFFNRSSNFNFRLTQHFVFPCVFLGAFLLLFASCGSLPQQTEQRSSMIVVGPGPEDILLDREGERILVSCYARRETETAASAIFAIDIKTDKAAELKRLDEPADLVFNPHGFDLWENPSGDQRLTVISHDEERDQHLILQYQLDGDELRFLRKYESDLLPSPNSVVSMSDGSILVTNDAKKRRSKMEALLKRKGSTVVHINKRGEAKVAANKLSYANGITRRDEMVYVSTTRQNRLFAYRYADGELIDQQEICTLKGADNLRWDEDHLLTTSHPKIFAFLRHFKTASKKSPSVVYRIDPSDGGKKVLYSNDGREISAASTAIFHEGYLYIAQVFDPFVLKVKL